MTSPTPGIPAEAAMTQALEEARAAFTPPGPTPRVVTEPPLTAEQEQYLAALLYRLDLDPTTFYQHTSAIDLVDENGALDPDAIAGAAVRAAHTQGARK